MRPLGKATTPEPLVTHADEWAIEYLDAVRNGEKLPTRWQHSKIKQQLMLETEGRCAYCDTSMLAVSFGDIEHILPREHRPELVVTWGNLTLACQRCNGSKKAYYSETLPLLNPYKDDPREHLTFLGELVFVRHGSERGKVTILKLKLGRQQLNASRRRRLEEVSMLLIAWSQAGEELRDEMAEMIRENVLAGDHLLTVLPLLEENHFDTADLESMAISGLLPPSSSSHNSPDTELSPLD